MIAGLGVRIPVFDSQINNLASCVIQSNSTIYRTGGLDLIIPTSSENLGAQIGEL